MPKAKRRWGCAQYAVGCMGVLLGIAVTIGGEIYLGALAVSKISATMRELEENGPDPGAYKAMCGNQEALKHDSSLRRSCEKQLAKMQAAAKRKAEREAASQQATTRGSNQR